MGTGCPKRHPLLNQRLRMFPPLTQKSNKTDNNQDITKASARAFRIGGFNYTQSTAQNRIVDSLSSNGALTPFADGAGWEGTWTLPVCDTGTNNWNTQYGAQPSRYGMLPCCCGKFSSSPISTPPRITLMKKPRNKLHRHQNLRESSQHGKFPNPPLRMPIPTRQRVLHRNEFQQYRLWV
jgi:hypothetical protein